jgi:hypothetical protein
VKGFHEDGGGAPLVQINVCSFDGFDPFASQAESGSGMLFGEG